MFGVDTYNTSEVDVVMMSLRLLPCWYCYSFTVSVILLVMENDNMELTTITTRVGSKKVQEKHCLTNWQAIIRLNGSGIFNKAKWCYVSEAGTAISG